MHRREFLIRSASGLGAAWLGSKDLLAALATQPSLSKLVLAQLVLPQLILPQATESCVAGVLRNVVLRTSVLRNRLIRVMVGHLLLLKQRR